MPDHFINKFTSEERFLDWIRKALLRKIANKTANYTATQDDTVIIVDTGGTDRTITLPSVSSMKGKILVIIKSCSGTDSGCAVILDGSGSETIDGGATYDSVDADHDAVILFSDGVEWYIIGKKIA